MFPWVGLVALQEDVMHESRAKSPALGELVAAAQASAVRGETEAQTPVAFKVLVELSLLTAQPAPAESQQLVERMQLVDPVELARQVGLLEPEVSRRLGERTRPVALAQVV
jgi:hypothetical protein